MGNLSLPPNPKTMYVLLLPEIWIYVIGSFPMDHPDAHLEQTAPPRPDSFSDRGGNAKSRLKRMSEQLATTQVSLLKKSWVFGLYGGLYLEDHLS